MLLDQRRTPFAIASTRLRFDNPVPHPVRQLAWWHDRVVGVQRVHPAVHAGQSLARHQARTRGPAPTPCRWPPLPRRLSPDSDNQPSRGHRLHASADRHLHRRMLLARLPPLTTFPPRPTPSTGSPRSFETSSATRTPTRFLVSTDGLPFASGATNILSKSQPRFRHSCNLPDLLQRCDPLRVRKILLRLLSQPLLLMCLVGRREQDGRFAIASGPRDRGHGARTVVSTAWCVCSLGGTSHPSR